MQMAGNLADIHGQAFVLGDDHHTDMLDGSHDESPDNPTFGALPAPVHAMSICPAIAANSEWASVATGCEPPHNTSSKYQPRWRTAPFLAVSFSLETH